MIIPYVVVVIDVEPIRERFSTVAPFLDERGRRLVAAAEAFAAGYGGIAAAEHDRTGSERIGAGRTIGASSAAGGGAQASDCQGPDIGRGSRGAGRTDDAGGSGIAVAVDLQKRATIGRSAAAAGPPGEPHPGG